MKVLFATDGTKHSKSAVDMVKTLGLTAGDEVMVVSVVDVAFPVAFEGYTGYVPDTSALQKVVRENAEQTLQETKEELTAHFSESLPKIETSILSGSPESEIVEKAEALSSDLIIVGSHGYNRWERLLLGSVSDSVVHHAPCSVLVVRSRDE